jgi:carbamoyltransferase
MRVLGISAFYHDSAAAVVEDGRIVAAMQEERFSRKKHDASFPRRAIGACLKLAGRSLAEFDIVAFYEKPFLKFERLIETYAAMAPRGFRSFQKAMPLWLKEKLFQKRLIKEELCRFEANFDVERRLIFMEHHLSHAASAFYPSPYTKAFILTMDGVGEWTTTSLAIGNYDQIRILKEIYFPHSLGLLYSAMTYYLGFKVNSGEYKVMGLAPYGVPRYRDRIYEHLIDVKEDGSFRLNMEYFDYCTGLTMVNRRFEELFGGPPRRADAPIEQRHMDLAASIQSVTEEIILRLCRSVRKEIGDVRHLCLAGGVALNCVANGKLLRENLFDGIWVQPAAGDAGGALGAALGAYHLYARQPRKVANAVDGMNGSYLGPAYSTEEIVARLNSAGAVFCLLSDAELIKRTAENLAEGKAVGWFQGRMEFGPRALGNRSILADPRSPIMQKVLNVKIKFRESFRPFAPAVLRDKLEDWFELETDSPYMLLTARVRQERCRVMSAVDERKFGIDKLNVVRSEIPAVTHVDYSARIQTVHKETNPLFYNLIHAFAERTGCPVLVNTSFNIRGEPIVCTPEDAFRCFMGTDLDVLAIGNAFLLKKLQNPALKHDYRQAFELD